MSATPQSAVTVTKNAKGAWVFVLKHKGVTYPAQGPFQSMLQAQAAGTQALEALQTGKR